MWYYSKVVKIEPAAPDVKRFWIEKPNNFEFRAGQFITFDLPIGEKRLQRWRSYSIANAPQEPLLELCIVRSPSGVGTRYFFEEVGVGTELKFKGPDGAFFLPETLDDETIFICTGTGVAPFRSMLLDLKNKEKMAGQRLHLIFGTRFESGILYRTEFEAMAAQFPDFQFDVALSRDQNWQGTRGYVHEIYIKKYAQPQPNRRFYLCGWTNMIDEAVANLMLKMGYAQPQIKFELYG